MINFKFISIIILGFMPLFLLGQIRPEFDSIGEENEQTDRKSEKYVKSRVVAWTLKNLGASIDSVKLDTLNNFYHNYHPIYNLSISNTYTGNYGGAYSSNDFSKRNYNTEYYFARTHDAYLLTPELLKFYNTTTPYTLLDYSQSENKNRQNETRFNVLHSQNITPDLNFVFRYDQAKSDGQYNYQANNNNSIALYSSYNKERLNIYGGFISNRIRNQENGGMVDDDKLLEVEDPEYISMRLVDARSEIRNSYIFAAGEYKVGTKATIDDKEEFKPVASAVYFIKMSSYLRHFWEGEKSDNSEFFPDYFLNPEFTHDSARFRSLKNQLQIVFHESGQKKFSFGQRAFIGADVVSRSFAAPGYDKPVYPFHSGRFENHLYLGPDPRWNKKTYANMYVGGGIFRRLGNFWTWDVEGLQYVTGYLAGQTEIKGILSKPFIFWKDTLASFTIKGELLNRVPDYFQNEYFSNRFQWKNSFINEQIMNASFGFSSPKRKLETGIGYSLINNFIYHGKDGIPAQTRNEVLILSSWLNKNFTLGPFGLNTWLLWQKASAQQYLHLPELSARLAPYLEFVISKVLFSQIGIDARINTKYYADAYNPATGFFYLQNEKLLGGYPYLDAFANLRLKRTNVFLQFMNVGSRFLNRPYFTALNYPMNKMTFRLGVSWSFYN
jgi:hypothetical protein